MKTEITVPVGIVLERRDSTSRWVDHIWTPVAVVPEMLPTDGWQLLVSHEGLSQFQYAAVPLTLHRRMGEAYDANVETESPAVWVMLDDDDADTVPYKVRGVTADPYEAQGMLDAGEGIVERVPMPAALVQWMIEYLKQMPEPEAFRKRKRVPTNFEESQFGKDPIFAPGGRRDSGEDA